MIKMCLFTKTKKLSKLISDEMTKSYSQPIYKLNNRNISREF